jgi:hypothetical protein
MKARKSKSISTPGGSVTGSDLDAVRTARLLVRPPREADRFRFVELFCDDDLLAIIDPQNIASQNVCRKLGFTFWKQAPVEGDLRNLYRLVLGVSSVPQAAGGRIDLDGERAGCGQHGGWRDRGGLVAGS